MIDEGPMTPCGPFFPLPGVPQQPFECIDCCVTMPNATIAAIDACQVDCSNRFFPVISQIAATADPIERRRQVGTPNFLIDPNICTPDEAHEAIIDMLPPFMRVTEMENFLCDLKPYVREMLHDNVKTHIDTIHAVSESDFSLFLKHIQTVVDEWLEIDPGPPPVFPVEDICAYYERECRFYTSYALFWFWGDCVLFDNCGLEL